MSKCRVRSCRMPVLSKEDKLRLLTTILESRHADLREQNLNHQGKGHFHVSGMGHEALAAVSIQTEPGDYIVPYYRDRGLVLGRGKTTRTASACRRGRTIRSRSTFSNLTTGAESRDKTCSRFMTQPQRRSRKFAQVAGRSFSGSRWSAFPVTPVPMIRNFIVAPKNCRHWRNQTPSSAGKIN